MNTTTADGPEHQRYLHDLAEITDRVHDLPAADQAMIAAAFDGGTPRITATSVTAPAAGQPATPVAR
jgi:hypothetical protein